jgi:type 1 fimbriae regulatory protein FimB/type 1 fimbriae regulatory protein FimE
MIAVIQLKPQATQTPSTENGKVPPRRQKNRDVRSREYLTDKEVTRLQEAAKRIGRHGHRDATLILLAYRHGLLLLEGWERERQSPRLWYRGGSRKRSYGHP